MGNSGKHALVGALALLLAFTGLVPGGTQPALALIVADRITTVNTAAWSPNAPGPSGIAYRPETNTLIVVDGDAAPTLNLWEYSLTTRQVVYSASIDVNGDATGLSWDSTNDVLYVSSDSSPQGIYMFQPSGAGEGQFGGSDDGFISVEPMVGGPGLLADVEDPALDSSTGNLFFLNGNTSQVYEIAPNTGGFGNGDDTIVTAGGFPVPADPSLTETPPDWEGMTLDGANLLIGAKDPSDDSTEEQGIWVVSRTGVFIDRIDTAVIANELGEVPPLTISGLTVQPAGGGEPKTYWIADRGDYNPPATNDGRLHRIHPGPVVVPDEPPAITPAIPAQSGNEGTQITFQATAVDDFGDELTWSLDAGFPPGALINEDSGVFTWTPTEAQGRGAPAYTVRVRVTDAAPGNNSVFQDVQITANEVNQAPVITDPGSLTRSEGESIDVAMVGSDSDIPANALTWAATGLPSGVSIHPTSGVISGTVAAGASSGSPYNVTVSLTDNGSPFRNDQVAFPFIVEPATGPPDPDPDPTPDNPFVDDNGHIFENAIEWLAGKGITEGCNPPTNDRFCPNDPVTRGQMAVFLVRAFGYSDNGGGDLFVDDDGLFYENSADRLFTAGVTVGCNPPTNNRYCGENSVTRGQMAAFLVRAFDLPAYNGPDRFVDDNGNIFEGAIERLAQAGITLGCNPPTNNRFCPDDPVTRGQMAAFLKRAFGE